MIPQPQSQASDRPPVPEWAITFADMMSLLLTFFVLVASFSYTDASKYRALAGSMRSAFGSGENLAGPADVAQAQGDASSGPNSESALVEAKLVAVVQENGSAGVSLVRTSDGLRLRISEGKMFDLGSVDLRPESRPFLGRLAPILTHYPGRIWIEGHTDDLPIKNQLYPSNWELSAARAANVVRGLVRSGVPESRLAAVGYADTHPLAPNADDASRGANRRVEIFLQQEQPSRP